MAHPPAGRSPPRRGRRYYFSRIDVGSRRASLYSSFCSCSASNATPRRTTSVSNFGAHEIVVIGRAFPSDRTRKELREEEGPYVSRNLFECERCAREP